MARKRAFISFDFDNDDDIRNALVGQARYPNSPFEIVDASVRKRLRGDWKKPVRNRIRRADLVIVMCGEYTHQAEGVAVEVKIAREEGIPYFLLNGRKDRVCTKPTTALHSDEILDWTWDNLRKQIEGKNILDYAVEGLPWILAGAALALWIRSRERKVRESRIPSPYLAQRRHWLY